VKKSLALVLVAVFSLTFIPTAFAADTATDQWQISTWAYFQASGSSRTETFDPLSGKLTAVAKYNSRISGQVELQPVAGNPLVKAFVTYTQCELLNLRVGQQSNPLKFVEPAPEQKEFVYYATQSYWATNPDDIGVAAFGKRGRASYHLFFCNGTGRNVPDNNSEKDIVGYLCLKPVANIQMEGCGVYGQQPSAERIGGFGRLVWTANAWANLQSGVIGRKDMHAAGWYVAGQFGLKDRQITARVFQQTQDDELVYTLGSQFCSQSGIKV
jgi:hypothetical protein